MILREYRLEDHDAVADISRRQYLKLRGEPPKMDAIQADNPNQCIRAVMVDDDGRIVAAVTGNLRLELGLIVDPADFEGPATCMGWIVRGFAKLVGVVHGLGLDTIYARVEDKRFARRLEQKLGFNRSGLQHLYFNVGEEVK